MMILTGNHYRFGALDGHDARPRSLHFWDILFLALVAGPTWADQLADIKARGRLVVGISDVTPPFSFRRPGEGEPVGYDLDLVRRVAQKLGVALEMVSIPDTQRIPILQQGKVDLVKIEQGSNDMR